MIFSTIQDVLSNDVRDKRLSRALEFLRETDMAGLACGRHDIMGDEVYANVMAFDTVAPSEKEFEAHRRYADIHYCIEGTELIGVATIDEVDLLGDFNEADDFGIYHEKGRVQWVTLTPGDLLVTYPFDAHKPGCHPEDAAPAHLKKACVKVLVA